MWTAYITDRLNNDKIVWHKTFATWGEAQAAADKKCRTSWRGDRYEITVE